MEIQQDLLADVQSEMNLERASPGIRFANYIIDVIIFYVLVFTSTIFLASVIVENNLMSYVISYTIYIIYYTILEGATKGKSIGKIVTGTRAVKNDGSSVT